MSKKMNPQQDSPAGQDPVVDLHQLDFTKTQDDGRMAVFQAKTGDIKKTDEPVLELTVTMASPAGDEKASQEIQKFLSEVRVGFAVTAPKPGGGPGNGQSADTFDIDPGIVFNARLIQPDLSKVHAGATVVVQAVAQSYPRPTQILIALVGLIIRILSWLTGLRIKWVVVSGKKDSVVKGYPHHYPAPNGQEMNAKVESTYGSAMVSPPGGPISQGGFCRSKGTMITVAAVSSTCNYIIWEYL